MSDDLVKQLLDSAQAWNDEGECGLATLEREAAYCIEDQQKRIEQLEAALRHISNDGNWGPNGCWEGTSYPDEIALAALEGKKNV